MDATMNPALQALLTLKKMSSPTAPGPGGQGVPTVAAQTMQQAAPAAMQEVAQQAGLAAPMLAQKAEDERIASVMQRLQQAQGTRGIEGLPAPNMRFSDGGLAGIPASRRYASQGLVSPEEFGGANPEAAEWWRERQRALLDYLRGKGTVYEKTESGLPEAAAAPAPAPAPAAAPAYGADAASERVKRSPAPPPARDKKPTAAPAPAPAATAAPAPAPPNPALAELAALGKLTYPVGEAPTAEGYYAAQDDARKRMGLTGLPGAAMEASRRQLEEQYAKSVKDRPILDLIADLTAGGRGGLTALGRSYVKRTTEQQAKDLQFRETLNNMTNAVMQLREAQAANDAAGIRAAQNAYRESQRDAAKFGADNARVIVQVSAQLAEGAAQRAFQATEGQANRNMQLRVAGMSQRPPEVLQLLDLIRRENPNMSISEGLGVISGARQAPKTREQLMKKWSDSITLQVQYPTFAAYEKAMNAPAGAAPQGFGPAEIVKP